MRGLLWLLVLLMFGVMLWVEVLPALPPGMYPCGCLIVELA